MAYEILGLGCIAWDQLLYLRKLPAENEQAEVFRRAEQAGGTTGTALRAAARYGATAAWSGIVGEDDVSTRVLAALAADGVDLSHVRRIASAGVIQTVVLVNTRRHTRTVLYELGTAQPCAEDNPSEATIAAAKVLLVDHFGIAGMLRAVRIASERHIPVVADFGSSDHEGFDELIAAVGHLILSAPFACQLTDAPDPAVAVARLWNDNRQAVIVTCGAAGCWYRDHTMPTWATHHFPAPDVEAVDTTGCGDVFHGIYAATLADGLPLEERLQQATIAAAIKATRYAGPNSIPTRAEIEEFANRWPG